VRKREEEQRVKDEEDAERRRLEEKQQQEEAEAEKEVRHLSLQLTVSCQLVEHIVVAPLIQKERLMLSMPMSGSHSLSRRSTKDISAELVMQFCIIVGYMLVVGRSTASGA